MASTLATGFGDTSNEVLLTHLQESVAETVKLFKDVILNITNEDVDNSELKLFFSEEGRVYMNEVTYNWNNLRPKIEPFALKILAPYTAEYLKSIKCKYYSFVTRLNEFKLSYLILLYSNGILVDHLKYNKECLKKNRLQFISGSLTSGIPLELSSELIEDQIDSYSKFRKENYDITCDNICKLNAHYLRTKALNEVYETINYYFEDKESLEKLHSYDWFRVLFILGNVSTYSSSFKTIHFPIFSWLKFPYPNSINWNGINIINGQLSKDIRYNDKQIIELLDYVVGFFSENESTFNKN